MNLYWSPLLDMSPIKVRLSQGCKSSFTVDFEAFSSVFLSFLQGVKRFAPDRHGGHSTAEPRDVGIVVLGPIPPVRLRPFNKEDAPSGDPFGDVEQHPRVLHRADVRYSSSLVRGRGPRGGRSAVAWSCSNVALLGERPTNEVHVDHLLRSPPLKIQRFDVLQYLSQIFELLRRRRISRVPVGMVLEDKLTIVGPSLFFQFVDRLLCSIEREPLKGLHPLRGEPHQSRVPVARGLVHTWVGPEELFYFRSFFASDSLKADFQACETTGPTAMLPV